MISSLWLRFIRRHGLVLNIIFMLLKVSTTVHAFSTSFTEDLSISTPMQYETNGVRVEKIVVAIKPNIVFVAYRDQDHQRNGMYVVCDLMDHTIDFHKNIKSEDETLCSSPKVFYNGFVTSIKLLSTDNNNGEVILAYTNDRDSGYIITCKVHDRKNVNNVTCNTDNKKNKYNQAIIFETGASNFDASLTPITTTTKSDDNNRNILFVYSMRKIGMGLYARLCQYTSESNVNNDDLDDKISMKCNTTEKLLLKSNNVHPQDLKILILDGNTYIIVYSNWRNNMRVEMLICNLNTLVCPSESKVLNNKEETSHLSLTILPSPSGKTEKMVDKDGKLVNNVKHDKIDYLNVIFRTGTGTIKIITCSVKLESNDVVEVNCLSDPIVNPFKNVKLVSHVVATKLNSRASNMVVSFLRRESNPCDVTSMFCSIRINHQTLDDELVCTKSPSHIIYQSATNLKEPDTCTINSLNIIPVGTINNVIANTGGGSNDIPDTVDNNNDNNVPFAGMIMAISQGNYARGLINWFGCPSGSVEMIDDGQFSDNIFKCRLCDPGRYNENVSTNLKCRKCEKGTYNSKKGGISKSACILCPVGKHGDKVGASSEEMCNSTIPFFTTIVIWVISFASLLLFILILSFAYVRAKTYNQHLAGSFCTIICCCCTRLDAYEYAGSDTDSEDDDGMELMGTFY